MKQSQRLPAVQGSVITARQFVKSVVVGVAADVSDAITVIASELASNCVRHGASAFQIKVDQQPDHILIEVDDDGGGLPVMRSPGPTETSGRGLQITGALAQTWGVRSKPGSVGKTVWAIVAVPSESLSMSQELADHRSLRDPSHRHGGRFLFAVWRFLQVRVPVTQV